MNSAFYTGVVQHRRFEPRPHQFRYRLFMVYLDLAELDEVFAGSWLWSTKHAAPARFRREDYLGDSGISLDEAVRERVREFVGYRPVGPIRMLTHLRYFGYCFNPVTFYYCFDRTGERVDVIVAEINNTPWNERFSYVLPVATTENTDGGLRFRFAKQFHVSPYFPMTLEYDWRFTAPGERLAVQMDLYSGDAKVFDASLGLKREAIDGKSMARNLLTYPFLTMKVIAGIYFEAGLLRLKKLPFYDHPGFPSQPEK